MRKCLSPFFIGQDEPDLDLFTSEFDAIIKKSHVNHLSLKDKICDINLKIKDFVEETIKYGEKPIVLSGDCLSVIGCLAALEKSGTHSFLIWFDAHGDFHTDKTTISGHLGGMPLAMITGRGDLSLLNDVNLSPIPDRNIFFVGGRDLESGEKEAIESSDIVMRAYITEIINNLPKDVDFWIHFDTDYINPIDAPAMRYPVKGGASAMKIRSDLDTLANHINIIGVSISAWAPHLDKNGNTAKVCWNVISPLIDS